MAIITQYFKNYSLVELSGLLTAHEILQNVIKNNRGDNFKNNKLRLIDASELQQVTFNEKEMKTFIAVDRSSFVENEELVVIIINDKDRFQPLFQSYVDSMKLSPWVFHTVASHAEAFELAETLGIKIAD